MKRRRIAIVGVGMTRFGKHRDRSLMDLLVEASMEAIRDSRGAEPDSLFVSVMASELYENITGPANTLAGLLGFRDKVVMRVENTSGSGGAAIFAAWTAIASGVVDSALVVGGEKMTHKSTAENAAIIATLVSDYERSTGITLPSYAALMARYYMSKYGIDTEPLAHVAVKNHLHGSMNPKAHFQKRITLEDYYNSRVVAEPLRVMDYTPISDGAAAVMLMELDKALSYTDKPVLITGISGATDTHVVHERSDLLDIMAVRRSTEKALAMAGRNRTDVGLVELHDMATILEIVELESMGFYKPGEGWRAAVEGETRYDGSFPVNTSGGLKSKGHPIGATGVAQAYEIALQLRGLAGERQVREIPDAAMSMSMGGFGNNAYTIVYEPGW
ncbi:MAG: hypothetical protein F7C07_07845 [Desulfurococcales archaeon]|nr:hypothetical protein [Desulfurococcales archaeon]